MGRIWLLDVQSHMIIVLVLMFAGEPGSCGTKDHMLPDFDYEVGTMRNVRQKETKHIAAIIFQ
jgi:hypothetical protein